MNLENFSERPEVTKESIRQAIDFVLEKIDENLENFTYKFPSPASKNNIYEAVDNTN